MARQVLSLAQVFCFFFFCGLDPEYNLISGLLDAGQRVGGRNGTREARWVKPKLLPTVEGGRVIAPRSAVAT